ncbi:hypothetical protein [Embleya sp. NBC_00896]|uniref:hypothetical protein n=1 Tax=Embleya sp. NBC_00896 TaxID=2975961 RepID=UPI002F916044
MSSTVMPFPSPTIAAGSALIARMSSGVPAPPSSTAWVLTGAAARRRAPAAGALSSAMTPVR